jgi:hypothetical protein
VITADATIALTGLQVLVQAGLLIDAKPCGYVEDGYVDPGYFECGTVVLSAETIQALAAAVWSRQIPLSAEPVYTYGTTTFSNADIDILSYAIWSKTL